MLLISKWRGKFYCTIASEDYWTIFVRSLMEAKNALAVSSVKLTACARSTPDATD